VRDRFNDGMLDSSSWGTRIDYARDGANLTLKRTAGGRIRRWEKHAGDRKFHRCHDYWAWSEAITDVVREGWRTLR
jgi:hypothetical protein